MRTAIFGGHQFVFLAKGERAPNPFGRSYCNGMTIIWQRKSGKWDVREHDNTNWVEITDQLFDTENEAFNFAYERFVKKWDRIYRGSR